MFTVYENDNFSAHVENLQGELVIHLDLRKYTKGVVEEIQSCFKDFLRECDERGVDLVFALLPEDKLKLVRQIRPPDQEIPLPQPNGETITMFAWSTDKWA